MNNLNADAWSLLNTTFAILAVVVAIGIFFAQRKTKRLSYEITSNTQLLSVKDEIQGKVQVFYSGKEVKNVHLLTIRFTNTGNQSISSSDYERPLSIVVNADAKILTHEIIDETPENLGALISIEGNKIIFSPVLMNAKDSFSLKALISDFEGQPSIDGRINGVKSISQYRDGQWSFLITSLISFVLLIAGLANIERQGVLSVLGMEASAATIAISLLISGYLLMLFGMFKYKRALNMFRGLYRHIAQIQ